jgi:hypothetical protein
LVGAAALKFPQLDLSGVGGGQIRGYPKIGATATQGCNLRRLIGDREQPSVAQSRHAPCGRQVEEPDISICGVFWLMYGLKHQP